MPRRRAMRTSRLCWPISVVALVSASVATAQTTKPFEALEGARRDRIEQEQRAARDAAEQRRLEKKRKADEAAAKRAAAAKSAQDARSSANPVPAPTADAPAAKGAQSARPSANPAPSLTTDAAAGTDPPARETPAEAYERMKREVESDLKKRAR